MDTLRVAIPVFNGRVSPLLDVAASFLYADIVGGKVGDRYFVKLAENSSLLRISFLKEKGVSLLICSAVSRECACAMARMGITVLPGIIGDADEVLEAFARDALNSERFAMPGCCGGFGSGRRGCPTRQGRKQNDSR